MESKVFKTIKECHKKAFLERLSLNDNSSKKRYPTVSKLIRTVITSPDFFNMNFNDVVNETLTRELYLSQYERDKDVELLIKQLQRYSNYESALNRRILKKSGNINLLFHNTEIKVLYDLIVDNGSNVEIICYSRSGPELSEKARKPENKPCNSIELYLLYKACKQLYPNRNVFASFYHLKSKNDKSNNFVDTYELKEGHNIVKYTFNQMESIQIEKEIENILSIDLNLLSSETADNNNCRNCYLKNVCDRTKLKSNIPMVKQTKELKKASGTVKLTSSQEEAVAFSKGTARVNAGAGTGKTTTIALRVVQLLKDGVNPKDILLITFTKKAVEEMYEKISYWIKVFKINVSVHDLYITTFNGFGMNVIKKHHSLIGYDKNISLANKVTKYDIIFEILDNNPIEELDMKNPLLNFPDAKGAVIELSDYFNYIKIQNLNKGNAATELSKYNSLDISVNKKIYKLYLVYNEELKRRNMIEYQDQLRLCIELLSNYEVCRNEYCYSHIMIDEYQDTDPTQVSLVKILKSSPNFTSFVVVGDDAQAVYRFRLADQKNLIEFHMQFENVKDIFMVENYRSTKNILNASNKLVANNKYKIEKDLISGNNIDGEIPTVIEYSEMNNEYLDIARLIKKHTQNSENDFSEIAVISRNTGELFELNKVLEEQGIPAQFQLTVKLIEHKPIQDIIALAKVYEDKLDTLSGSQFVFSKLSNEKIVELSRQSDSDIMMFVSQYIESLNIPDLHDDKLSIYYDYVLNNYETDMTVISFIEELKSQNFVSIEQLVSYFKKMELYEDDSTIEVEESRYNAVNLITAHSSKGKEYNVVIVILDKFESRVNQENEEEVEEERRLLFVAMTRAKKNLYLTYYRKDKLCRYIDELDGVNVIKYR